MELIYKVDPNNVAVAGMAGKKKNIFSGINGRIVVD